MEPLNKLSRFIVGGCRVVKTPNSSKEGCCTWQSAIPKERGDGVREKGRKEQKDGQSYRLLLIVRYYTLVAAIGE